VFLGRLAGDRERAVEEVARVKLDARLRGENLHHPAALRLDHPGRQRKLLAFLLVEHVAVIVSAFDPGDPRPDRVRLGEVHGRAFHGGRLTQGNQTVVDRKIGVGVEHHLVRKRVARAGPGQVPIGVIGEVHRGGLVALGGVLHLEAVVGGQLVGDRAGQRAGIALVAVGAREGKLHAHALFALMRLGLPHGLIETLDAAVQVVGTVVHGQRVFGAAERELALGDPVGVAADDRSEIGMASQVAVERIEGERNDVELAVAVGRFDGRQRGAVGHDLDP